jgi:hypothetical protein
MSPPLRWVPEVYRWGDPPVAYPCAMTPGEPAHRRRRFPIRLGRRSRPLLLLFGVSPGRAWVELDGELDARFGFFRLRTPVANITRWRIEGPFRWLTAIGVRRSIRRGDVTFGGDTHGGVRIDFRERVRWGRFFRAPALYVTVESLEALAAELDTRGIRGEDARTQRRP